MINEKRLVVWALPLALVLFIISTTQASSFAPNLISTLTDVWSMNPTASPFALSFIPSILTGVWSMNPIKTPLIYAIAIEGVYPQNRSFLYQNITVNVNTVIPASYTSNKWNYSTTRRVLTYCWWYVFQNSTQRIILNSTLTNMTNTTYTASFVFNPQQPGIYTIGDVCKSSSSIFNTYADSWSAWSAPSIIAQDVKVINVVVPASFSPFQRLAIDINTFLTNIIYSIINAVGRFLKTLGV